MIIVAVVGISLLVAIAFLLTSKGRSLRDYIKFVITGLDSGFNLQEIFTLGKAGRIAEIKTLSTLYWSLPALEKCTQEIILLSKNSGKENDIKTQKLLSSLYKYRTSLELEQSKKRIGLESTRDINPGQRIRIVLKGVGIYSSRILKNNGTNLMIEFPKSPLTTSMPSGTSISWVGRTITAYLWRKEDAGYEFETTVIPVPQHLKEHIGLAVLFLDHSRKFVRTQKRKSVRAKCKIYAQLYILSSEQELNNDIEPEAGMKCLLEDISEDGAMILIGGKAIENMFIKLQFMVNDVLVVMAGYSKGVQYNKDKKQSRIHFESKELPPRMKNAVLAFVYNILPEEEKEILDAIKLSEEDSKQTEDINIDKTKDEFYLDPIIGG